jgi:hypothetical protein
MLATLTLCYLLQEAEMPDQTLVNMLGVVEVAVDSSCFDGHT